MHDVSRRSFLAAAGGLSLASVLQARSPKARSSPAPTRHSSSSTCRIASRLAAASPSRGRRDRGSHQQDREGLQNVVLTQDGTRRAHLVCLLPSRQEAVRDISCPTAIRSCGPTCVQGTEGALHKGLDIPHAQLVIRKGHNPVDSYSAFIEADGKLKTGLDGYLKARHQDHFRGRARHRFLCGGGRRWMRVLGLGRLCHRGCLPRHRHAGLAGRGLEERMEKAGVKKRIHFRRWRWRSGCRCHPGGRVSVQPGNPGAGNLALFAVGHGSRIGALGRDDDYCSTSAAIQHFALRDLTAALPHGELGDSAGAGRVQHVLHLHGFDHGDAIALGDVVAFFV